MANMPNGQAATAGNPRAAQSGHGPVMGRYRWVICAFLFAATTLNYLDRFTISFLKPTLSSEFHWSEIDYANIKKIADKVEAKTMADVAHIAGLIADFQPQIEL